jgi:hypothetical protein
MTSDADLDRILRAWVSEGGDRAPDRYIKDALTEVARTKQRARARWPFAGGIRAPRRPRPIVLVAILAAVLLAAMLVVGVGSTLLQDRDVLPVPVPEAVDDPPLRVVPTEDWSVDLSIPDSWSQVGDDIAEYRDFGGVAPEGHLSASHENPYNVTLCTPDCVGVEVEMTIPYDAATQLARLKSGIATVAGDDAWTDLPADVLPEIVDGVWLDTTGPDKDGRAWRRVYVAGLIERNLVGIAWSQPADVFDETLMRDVLGAMTLTGAPVYSDGDLLPTESGDWSMPIPGMWQWEDQPTFDGSPLRGIRRWGDGRVVVSIGAADGTLGWCDPDCRELTGMTSVEAVEAAIRGERALGPAQAVTLGGEPALAFGTDTPVERRYVVAMHDGRPVALMIDAGEWEVAAGVTDEMISGFQFIDPVVATPTQTFTWEEGGVELVLPDGWQRIKRDDGSFLLARGESQRLWVFRGDDDGLIRRCVEPAGPWEQCDPVKATTLEELLAAVAPIDDRGAAPPAGGVEQGILGGEPSVVAQFRTYEYPARGAQEVVSIVAMHDGRPYIVRIWTGENDVRDLDAVIAGFWFVD